MCVLIDVRDQPHNQRNSCSREGVDCSLTSRSWRADRDNAATLSAAWQSSLPIQAASTSLASYIHVHSMDISNLAHRARPARPRGAGVFAASALGDSVPLKRGLGRLKEAVAGRRSPRSAGANALTGPVRSASSTG